MPIPSDVAVLSEVDRIEQKKKRGESLTESELRTMRYHSFLGDMKKDFPGLDGPRLKWLFYYMGLGHITVPDANRIIEAHLEFDKRRARTTEDDGNMFLAIRNLLIAIHINVQIKHQIDIINANLEKKIEAKIKESRKDPHFPVDELEQRRYAIKKIDQFDIVEEAVKNLSVGDKKLYDELHNKFYATGKFRKESYIANIWDDSTPFPESPAAPSLAQSRSGPLTWTHYRSAPHFAAHTSRLNTRTPCRVSYH